MKYGRITVGEPTGLSKNGRRTYNCTCDCGTPLVMSLKMLKNGNTQSCGCLRREMVAAKNFKHGNAVRQQQEMEYRIWKAMRERCNNPNNPKYHRYGGRGITIDRAWNDFTVFLKDMGKSPSLQHSIDRINNDGNYEPSNCRWATVKEQSRNKRTSRFVTYKGKRATLAEWSELTGFGYSCLFHRLKKGWSVESTLTVAPRLGKNQYASSNT